MVYLFFLPFLLSGFKLWFVLGLSKELKLSYELGLVLAGAKVIPRLMVILWPLLALRMGLVLEMQLRLGLQLG